jgi:hypothetical protein
VKSLASSAQKVAAPVLGRRGFAEAEIVLQWAAIVGEDLAALSQPVKLSFAKGAERTDGTLHLRVKPGAALEFQHWEPVLLERINGIFGYKAVGRLALRQGPLGHQPRRAPKPPQPLGPAAEKHLTSELSGIADPELRAALEALGRAVLGTKPPTGS